MPILVLKASPEDNVAMVLAPAAAGSVVEVDGAGVALLDDIDANHKFALCDIPQGAPVIKYGHAIGRATADIRAGQWVHSHNLGE